MINIKLCCVGGEAGCGAESTRGPDLDQGGGPGGGTAIQTTGLQKGNATRTADPGCLSRILIFYPSRIRIQRQQ